jgi:alkanesulfonate monooxygenase
MSLRFHWFLPTNGDGRDIVGGGHGVAAGAAGAIRPPSVQYLGQIARSAEQLGFEAALTPTGAWCEDAWLTTAMLTEVTERLKFLVAFRPGQLSPTLSAQMASTFQRLSGERLLLNVVTGGESAEQRAYGDFLGKDERYERTGEFLDIVSSLWRGETVTRTGRHLQVEGAQLARLPVPVPDIYFGGSSRAAGPVAAKYANVYLTWGEPPAAVEAKLRWIEGLGISEFILSGYPHLEEAYWFGEGVLPILARRGAWRHPAPGSQPPQTITPFAPTAAREPVAAS